MSNIFENSYTKLFSKVKELNTPSEYIVYKNIEGEDFYYSLPNILLENEKLSLIEIFNEYGNKITFQKFIYLYSYFYLYKDSSEENKKRLLNIVNDSIILYNQKRKDEGGKIISSFNEFSNVKELMNNIKIWYNGYTKELNQDLVKYTKIKNIQDKLLEIEPINIDLNDVKLEKMTNVYEPELDLERETNLEEEIEINPKIGILIFNQMVCSEEIPYIQLNNYDGEKYYKVYDSDTLKDIGKIIDQEYKFFNNPDTFYFKILMYGEEKSFLYKTTDAIKKSSYLTCTYDLNTNKIKFICEDDVKEDIVRKLNKCYKLFNIVNDVSRQYNINGDFIIKNFSLNPAVVHFLIFNEAESGLNSEYFGFINTYFFINETDKTLAEQKSIEIKFKTINVIEDDDYFTTSKLPSSLSAKILNYDNNLIIKFSRTYSLNILYQFIEIFTRFLSVYKEYESNIIGAINSFIEDEEAPEYKVKSTKVTEKKIKQLRDNLFKITNDETLKDTLFNPGTTGYTRTCECKKQPIIITDVKDEEDWANKTFTYKNKKVKRQIGEFPPNEQIFKFVCPDDEYPFPSLTKNNDPENAKKFPFVPCCAKTDEINNPKSNYNNYANDKIDKSNINKVYKLNTMKHLEFGRIGELPKQIQTLLNLKKNSKVKFSRYGVGLSQNSLLQCIMKAINDNIYLELSNNKEREKYCITTRRKILNSLPNYLNIVKQEMYNYTDNEIMKLLKVKSYYFNSALLYRLLEEYYNINLYVLLHKENIQYEDNSSEEAGIEVPNHSMFYVRPYRPDRQTVIVIKHIGGEMEGLKYPQYDLIFDTGIPLENEETKKLALYDKKFLFEEDMNQLMYDTFYKYINSFIFQYNEQYIETRSLQLFKTNWEIIFKDLNFISQNIDIYGKVTSFNLQVPLTDIKFTVYVPPSQPLNLPNDSTLYKTKENIVREIFGKEYKVDREGLWYTIYDKNDGIFVYCETKGYTSEASSPIVNFTKKDNKVIDFRNAKKYSKMLLDCIVWGLRSNGVINFEDYMLNYENFIIEDKNLRHNIPPNKNISFISSDGDFRILSNIWPEYFTNDNKVRLYPELYDKIVKYLAIYYKSVDGLSLPAEPYLSDIFKYEWDFISREQNRILIGEIHLQQWIENKNIRFNGEVSIVKQLDFNILNNSSDIPIIYDFDGKYYLIQNVKDGDFYRALNCGDEWIKNKINLGYDSSPLIYNEIPYLIYNVSNSFELFIGDENDIKTQRENKYVTLLKIDDIFKVMLEI
jgi:hypothetical protein